MNTFLAFSRRFSQGMLPDKIPNVCIAGVKRNLIVKVFSVLTPLFLCTHTAAGFCPPQTITFTHTHFREITFLAFLGRIGKLSGEIWETILPRIRVRVSTFDSLVSQDLRPGFGGAMLGEKNRFFLRAIIVAPVHFLDVLDSGNRSAR